MPGSCPISLIPKRGGIIGKLPKLHDFQLGVYSCGSFRVQRCPNVQVTWYPFLLYILLSGMSAEYFGYITCNRWLSAMQTIILSFLFYTISLQSYTNISHRRHEAGKSDYTSQHFHPYWHRYIPRTNGHCNWETSFSYLRHSPSLVLRVLPTVR